MTDNRPYYFVASHKVLNRSTINEVYVPKAVACLNKFDVEVLAVNETPEVIEGQTGHDRLVILRFPSRDEAMRWYNSPEYQSMIHLRLESVEGTLILAEGLNAQDLAEAGVTGHSKGDAPAAPAATARVAPPRSTGNQGFADSFRSGELATSGFQGWTDSVKREFSANAYNGKIGTDLVFENDLVRVWHMTLEPGEKMPVHRHVLTYFWTAITPGRFLQRTYDGTTYESDYQAGLTHFYHVKSGEFALHNLENVGDTKMVFVAVELKKESANLPLSLFESQPMPRPEAIDTSRQAENLRSGELTTSNFQGWSDAIRLEFRNNEFNGRIGTDLVFENSSVRVWHMTLKPGERMPVHRHVLTYLWTAITPGRFLQRTYDGTTYQSDYDAGLTHFYDVGEGEFALHDLENVGDATMIFCAVELKRESANQPLPL
ncbi:MAG: DUF1330 domain-containing protein [Boseongicola sp.]|nr:DUF1330 domain-containing protein [Boseongicola sp.]